MHDTLLFTVAYQFKMQEFKETSKNRHLPSKSSPREKYFIFAFVSNTSPQKFNLHANKYILTFLIQDD